MAGDPRIPPGGSLRDSVAWAVDPATARGAVGVGCLAGLAALPLVILLGDAAAFGGRRAVARHLPDDPEQPVRLGDLDVEADARWMPPVRQGPVALQVSCRGAWTNEGATAASRRELPLTSMRVVSVRPMNPWRRRRTANSEWSMVVTDGKHEATINGRWLALAFLGTVAGWPDPPRPE